MDQRFDFEFDLDQKVVTPFGDDGLIEMLGFDDGGRKYYVQTATNSNWFKEGQLQEGMDYVADFVKALCKQGSECEITSVDLYSEFIKYCSANGFPRISQKKFSNGLSSLGCLKRKRGGVLYWVGLSLTRNTTLL